MRTSGKIWYGLGACVSVAAVAAVATQVNGSVELPLVASAQAAATAAASKDARPKGTFVGDLDSALANIFAGEGGESGAGLTPMWPSVTAPALTGAEITRVVAGNTLQLPGHVSYYFTKSNSVEGRYIHWDQLPSVSACPAQNVEGGDYYLNPTTNVCWKQTILPLQGTWAVKSHQLCLDVSWSGGKKQDCRYVTILLDNIAMFDASGVIDGKGHKLFQGKKLEQ